MFAQKVVTSILATKTHTCSEEDEETKILIDLDMGILNEEWEKYESYSHKIRQ